MLNYCDYYYVFDDWSAFILTSLEGLPSFVLADCNLDSYTE